MKGIPLILIALVIAGGCIQTPAKVASGMPAVLKNVSNDVGNITGPIERNISIAVMGTPTVSAEPTFAPVKVIRV
jgi:hypothetical protein